MLRLQLWEFGECLEILLHKIPPRSILALNGLTFDGSHYESIRSVQKLFKVVLFTRFYQMQILFQRIYFPHT